MPRPPLMRPFVDNHSPRFGKANLFNADPSTLLRHPSQESLKDRIAAEKGDDGEISIAEVFEIAGKTVCDAAEHLPGVWAEVGESVGGLLVKVAAALGEDVGNGR